MESVDPLGVEVGRMVESVDALGVDPRWGGWWRVWIL